MPVDQLVRGTDGCSAPSYVLPLRSLAHASARLTLAKPDPICGEAPQRVARAMGRHPERVSGQGRNDLAFVSALEQLGWLDESSRAALAIEERGGHRGG